MQVRWTKGWQLCYQDHVVNFRQDITEIADRLPRLPDTTDIVIIRKESVGLGRHVKFHRPSRKQPCGIRLHTIRIMQI
jgi:hypothetical protein